MTPTEINNLKRRHNAELEKGQELYAEVLKVHKNCLDMQAEIEREEGDEYDPIPLLFGDGFWIDETL